MNENDIAGMLVRLCQVAADSYYQLHHAAGQVSNAQLKYLLRQEGLNRAELMRELQSESTRLSGAAVLEGPIGNHPYDFEIAINSAMEISDDAVLDNVEVSEESLLKHFDLALQTPLPTEIAELIKRSYVTISETAGLSR